jgi:hypothetical protein
MNLDRKILSSSFSLIIISIFRLILSSYVWMRTKNEIDNIFDRLLSKKFSNNFDCCSSVFAIFELKARISFVESKISFSWILFSIVFDRRFFLSWLYLLFEEKIIDRDTIRRARLSRIEQNFTCRINSSFLFERNSQCSHWSKFMLTICRKKQYSFNQKN